MKKFVFEWRGLVDASNKAWGSFETLDNLSINIPLVGYFIFFAIGSSPWLLANAIFLQLPFLQEFPQEESIASQIALALQLGNLLIPFYLIFRSSKVDIKYLIFAILLISFLTSFGFAIVWQVIPQNSNALWITILVLSFFAGSCGCLSNVLFFEFTANYHPKLITVLAIGNTAAGIFPVIIAAIQSPGEDARFGFGTFFLVNSIFLFISVVSFLVLIWTSILNGCKREVWSREDRKLLKPYSPVKQSPLIRVPSEESLSTDEQSQQQQQQSFMVDNSKRKESINSNFENSDQNSIHSDSSDTSSFIDSPVNLNTHSTIPTPQTSRSRTSTYTERSHLQNRSHRSSISVPEPAHYFLPEASSKELSQISGPLFIIFWISFVNYFFPAIFPFLTKSFEGHDKILVNLIITGIIGGALGRIFSGFFMYSPNFLLVIIQLVFSVFFFFGMAFNWKSWVPPVMIVSNFVVTFQYGYQSTMLFKIAAAHIDRIFAMKGCRWLGVFEQLGAFTSSVVGIVIVISVYS